MRKAPQSCAGRLKSASRTPNMITTATSTHTSSSLHQPSLWCVTRPFSSTCLSLVNAHTPPSDARTSPRKNRNFSLRKSVSANAATDRSTFSDPQQQSKEHLSSAPASSVHRRADSRSGTTHESAREGRSRFRSAASADSSFHAAGRTSPRTSFERHHNHTSNSSPHHHHHSSEQTACQPTPVAAAAFHAFLRQQNSPYVRPPSSAIHWSNDGGENEAEQRVELLRSDLSGAKAYGRDGGSQRKNESTNNSREERELMIDNYRAIAENARGGGQEVLQEWDLKANDVISPARRQGNSASSPAQPKPNQSTDASFEDQRTPAQLHSDVQRQRRYELVERARQDTLARLSDRHRHDYERTALHAYQLIKNVEGHLLRWSQQRRRLRGRDGVHIGGAAGEVTAADVPGDVLKGVGEGGADGGATSLGSSGDVDAVDARFFEYAGQLQRTLHQLTPRHFDAMQGYRLHRTIKHDSHADARAARRLRAKKQKGSTTQTDENMDGTHTDARGKDVRASPAPPLFHLRLLWRLLHITQLFYAIGRQAGLPRGAVHSYVQSANCAYGIREVLRVLGAELARASLGLSPASISTAPRQGLSANDSASDLSPSQLTPFTREELFQVFYASLCLPSEELPGVPIYDPALLANLRRRGGSGNHSVNKNSNDDDVNVLRFQVECATTSAVAARMPIDEWCVRWWGHLYALHNRRLSQGTAPSAPARGIFALLTLGQAMDVVRAALYASADHHPVASAGAAAPGSRSPSSLQRSGAISKSSSSRNSSAFAATPFTYFETPPRGVALPSRSKTGRSRLHESVSAKDSAEAGDAGRGRAAIMHGELDRRYRPRLIGALGGDRTLLRIPFHLGQHFVTVFLEYLLSTAEAASTSEDASAGPAANNSAEGKHADHTRPPQSERGENVGDDDGASSAATSREAAARVEAGVRRLLQRQDRDAVRDVALLCTAILYFEVFSPTTAAFMAHAAPLCHEQAELLSGHEISCVLLAYATLQRWEGRGRAPHISSHTMNDTTSVKGHASSAASRRHADSRTGSSSTVNASSTASKPGASHSSREDSSSGNGSSSMEDADAGSGVRVRSASAAAGDRSSSGTASAAPSSPSTSSMSWHLFYVTLGSRAGQLADTLSEEDVTRVLRAMELAELEHEDLRRALESSLRMRNLGRRVLYET